jgi:hypothetical protein
MKAAVPIGPYGTFSKADWGKIRQSLASIGVDLDTARISAHFEARSAGIYRYSASNQSWLSVMLSAGPEWRLSEVLQRLAYFYTLSEPKTAKQWAKELQRARAATEKALTSLRFVGGAPVNYPDSAMRSGAAKDRALYDLVTWKIVELQKRITKLRAIDSRNQSALKVQTKYWRELKPLWRVLVGPRKPLRRKLLGQFLLACSQPVFADMNTRVLVQKINSFLTNLYRA